MDGTNGSACPGRRGGRLAGDDVIEVVLARWGDRLLVRGADLEAMRREQAGDRIYERMRQLTGMRRFSPPFRGAWVGVGRWSEIGGAGGLSGPDRPAGWGGDAVPDHSCGKGSCAGLGAKHQRSAIGGVGVVGGAELDVEAVLGVAAANGD